MSDALAVTAKQAAELLGVSEALVRREIRMAGCLTVGGHEIPVATIGASKRIPLRPLLRALSATDQPEANGSHLTCPSCHARLTLTASGAE